MAAEEPMPEDLEIADELIAERRAEAPGETPEDMTPWQRPITAVIDVVNYRAGQMIALLMIPLIAVVVYEVISRNLDTVLIDAGFGNLAKALGLGPTLWVYDMSRMIAGVLWMAAAGYGLMRGVSNQSRVRYLSQSRFLFHLFVVVVVVFHEPSSF